MKLITLDVHLQPGQCGHRRLQAGKKPNLAKSAKLPRVSRLMALSIKYWELLENGAVEDQESLANLAGVDRSQISKLLRLRLLSPWIQEWLLELPEHGKKPVTWHQLDRVAKICDWDQQRAAFAVID